MNRITFIGDITCDRPLLNAAYNRNVNNYDFSPVFREVKDLFTDSNYVVGNFETVCGGDKNGFKNQYLLCNSPDELIQAMVKGGVNCVTTANNHCLDQGVGGLIRTIDELDINRVLHTGTFKYEDISKRILYLHVNNIVVALISNTYSTNASNTGIVLNDKNDFYVNLLKKQCEFTFIEEKIFKRLLFKLINARYRRTIHRIIARLRLWRGKMFFKPVVDALMNGDTDNKYLRLLEEDLKVARDKADYVIVCSHIGGQFNETPGAYSQFLADFVLEHGADILIGNHPHVIQKTKIDNGKVVAYSLGSFNQSPSADYIIHDALPEYSMALHVYLSKDRDKGNVRTITFSILKAVEDFNKMIVVYPIDKLNEELEGDARIQLQEDVKRIYERITGTPILKDVIQREYVLR